MNFNIELSGRIEELTNEQRSAVMSMLTSVDGGIDETTIQQVDEPEYPDTSMLSDHQQAIVEAVREEPGNQKGHYHEMLLDDDRTPYSNPDDEGYGERAELGHEMWELNVSEGGAHLVNSGRLWYPV